MRVSLFLPALLLILAGYIGCSPIRLLPRPHSPLPPPSAQPKNGHISDRGQPNHSADTAHLAAQADPVSPSLSDSSSVKQMDTSRGVSLSVDTANGSFKDSVGRRIQKPFTATTKQQNEKPKEREEDVIDTESGLTGPVKFNAKDSTIIQVEIKKIHLFKNADVKYGDVDVKGNHLEIDQNNSQVSLFPDADSLGHIRVSKKTSLRQGKTLYLSDTVRFNYQTQKSRAQNTYTKQGQMTVFGQTIKKVSDDEVYIRGARFSTCHLDHPHFAFSTSRAKFRQQKFGATSMTFLEIENLRVPVPIPFAMFPLSEGVKNGILPPSFDQNSSWGYGLREGGYYIKMSDYFNGVIRGSLYSFGTWTVNIRSQYKYRYRFEGSLNFDFQSIHTQLLGDLESNDSRTFNFQYSHSVDQKAAPNSNLNVNLNFGSTQYNRLQIYDPVQNFNNLINSSVNYSKQFKSLPSSLSISANHSQNSVNRLYNITFPSMSYSISNIQPLQVFSGRSVFHWWQKLTFQYAVNYNSNFAFFENDASIRKIIDTLRWGVQHIPSISLPLPAFGPFIVTPSITYRENWTDRRTIHAPVGKPTLQKGFFRLYDVAYNASVTTNIFGTFLFRNAYLRGIRHVIRPQISMSYRPNVNQKNFYDVHIPSGDGRFSRARRGLYEDALFGNFSEGESANLSFNISSSVEIKVRNKTDTTGKNPTKKISIIDNFNVGGSYNLLKDTFNPRQLSNIFFSMATSIARKVQFNASASLDPYAYDNQTGRAVRKLAWQDRNAPFSLGRFTNFSFTLSSSVNYESKHSSTRSHGAKTPVLSVSARRFRDSLTDIYSSNATIDTAYYRRIFRNHFRLSLSIGYNLSYSERFEQATGGYHLGLTNQNVTLSGNVNLTQNWSMNFSTSLHIARNFIVLALNQINIPYLTLGVQRRLHCWIINMSIVPIGITQSFSVVLQPVANILQDLKIQRNRSFYSQ